MLESLVPFSGKHSFLCHLLGSLLTRSARKELTNCKNNFDLHGGYTNINQRCKSQRNTVTYEDDMANMLSIFSLCPVLKNIYCYTEFKSLLEKILVITF